MKSRSGKRVIQIGLDYIRMKRIWFASILDLLFFCLITFSTKKNNFNGKFSGRVRFGGSFSVCINFRSIISGITFEDNFG